jgi:hypothetical protein
MYILLPRDSAIEDASLVKLDDVKVWTQINVEDGELKGIEHSDTKDGFSNFSECVVVVDDNEYVWPFMELSMLVLVAHTQRSIDDIVEAYLFKELHDLAY